MGYRIMENIKIIIKEEYIKQLLLYYMDDENVKKMKKYKQHKNTSTFDHSVHVAIISYKIATFFHMKTNNKEDIMIGAILHDFCLYDWRVSDNSTKLLHCWQHPKIALRNAKQLFNINHHQEDIIQSHMFPLTLLHPPKTCCGWVVSIADKICAVKEFFNKPVNKHYCISP